MEKLSRRHIGIAILGLKFLFIASAVWIVGNKGIGDIHWMPDVTFFWFVLAGFLAQLIDGALGMAYGVTSNSILLSVGLSPKVASAAVHTAEIFTTGVSGLAHMRIGNFDKWLFIKLLLPGVIGAVAGAFLLGYWIDGGIIKPYVSFYLMILGVIILYKAFTKKKKQTASLKNAGWLALFGGALDAIGGGGWGPIVSSNLIRKGNTPNIVIGTVNTVEFFVTFFSAGILIYFTGISSWQIILGLVVGGTLAAPLGALLTKKIKPKVLMKIVGFLIILISLYNLGKNLF